MKRDMMAMGVYVSPPSNRKPQRNLVVSLDDGDILPEYIGVPHASGLLVKYNLDEELSDRLRINLIRRTEENS